MSYSEKISNKVIKLFNSLEEGKQDVYQDIKIMNEKLSKIKTTSVNQNKDDESDNEGD